MGRIITLSDYEFTLCKLFSEESAKTQQAIEFGNREDAERSIREIARDNMIGKMAEAGVSRMLYLDFGKQFHVNYDIYPRGDCDDYDIVVNGWKLDIKSTRKGHYLMFETRKMAFRASSGTMPDVIVMCRTPWDEEKDQPSGKTVDIVGCVSAYKLSRIENVVRKGDCIPGTDCRTQAENYAMAFEQLSDFHNAVEFMLNNKRTDGG